VSAHADGAGADGSLSAPGLVHPTTAELITVAPTGIIVARTRAILRGLRVSALKMRA
jgi:hypothetical protein